MKFSARFLKVATPLALTVALAACSGGKSDEAGPSETAPAAPDAKPGITLTGARLALPAVKGNPGAVYFSLTNGSGKPVTLAAVDVTGAGMAMLHETRQAGAHATMAELKDPELDPGETLVLAPGGKHVMVDAIPAGWAAGGTTELTLVFADGDKLSVPLKLVAPGGE